MTPGARSQEDRGATPGRPAFTYRHTVGFADTNLVGNVYYAHLVAWQGRCRELFLKEHLPEVLDELGRDLRLVTLRTSCDFFDELAAFDEVEIRMRLAHVRGHRIGLDFEYLVDRDGALVIAAAGFQEVGCLRRSGGGFTPSDPPATLLAALKPFSGGKLSDGNA